MKSLVPVGKFLSGYGFSSAPLTLILGQLGLLRDVTLLPKVTLRKWQGCKTELCSQILPVTPMARF